MKKIFLASALLAFPIFAVAQTPPTPSKPDVVVIPRAFLGPMEQAIMHPHAADVGDILSMLQQLHACVDDNPVNGVVKHNGPDQCPPVSEYFAEQDHKEVMPPVKVPEFTPKTPDKK